VTRRTPALGALLALALATLALLATSDPTGAAGARDAVAVRASAGDRALARLSADSRGDVQVQRGDDGLARVVGVRGSHNPMVNRRTPVRAAARAHLARYGALVGVADRGTRLIAGDVTRSVTGHDIVRFTQRRHGLPVIGGAVAVDLRRDRQLGSVTASVSRATVPGATYPAAEATRQALAVTAKGLGARRRAELTADPPEHELYDPAVLGVTRTSDPATRARGVWAVEMQAGPAFHRLVLLDDRSGAVVQDLDLVEELDRVVCDDENALTTDVPCTHDFARTEHGPPSTVRDVNDAFRLAGVVSAFYHRLGHLDLTRLLGVDEGDHRSLSSTVRFCNFALPQDLCPYANAFWNGVGMFYGQGYASADDVVGHEMTHGVIQHSSDLFYWGQSGAINESLADIMGEILDHQHASRGDSPQSWTIGEDLPGGAIRSMRDPGRFRQPDSMTSRRYAPGGDSDNGGVHTNSGVGNRTFYLISQGGKQDGRTVHGIDGTSLRKSATLYLDVSEHLVSGSDYADLAAVLDSSCRSLSRGHTAGMTRANCRAVHVATLATRLRTTPPRAKQPPDAPLICPRGTGPVRMLFDSEKGTPRSKFDAGSTWGRAPMPGALPLPVTANATSGHASWYSSEPQDPIASSLAMRAVSLPAGRPAYLWFQQWRFLEAATDFDGRQLNYDAGTVEVADTTRGTQARPAEGLPWVNGPRDRINGPRNTENPGRGRVGFGRDSRGYLASRLSLQRYAGHAVSPRFTMNTDNSGTTLQGWYLDDIRVYTCGRGPVPRSTPRIHGAPGVGARLTASTGSWSPSHVRKRVHWYADGHAIAGATGTSYRVRQRDAGKRISVEVTATTHGRRSSTFSTATAPVAG
jgi:Zn-dependent metalloprotease